MLEDKVELGVDKLETEDEDELDSIHFVMKSNKQIGDYLSMITLTHTRKM